MNHNLFHIPGHTTIRKIGEGGMGAVFLATDNMLQRQVAIKVLKPSVAQEEDSMLRFQSEAITLAKLRHPHITMLYNLVQTDSRWCMMMEYVEGETLDVILKKRGRLTVKEVLDMAIPVLDALQHAHSKGVVHRDLKPSNLMLSVDGEVKIMDFGIARITGGSRLTRAGQAVGTPQYMSPEQVKGHEGNVASDIYSFGIVLYELLTGVTPFDSESEFEVMQAHTNRKPVPPASLNPDIPPTLNSAILRALEKEPSKRFADAAECKQCLLKIDEGAAPPTPIRLMPVRLKLPQQFTHPYFAGALFLAASLLLAFFVIFSTPEPQTPKQPISKEEQTLLIEIEPEPPIQKPEPLPQPISTTSPPRSSTTTPPPSSTTPPVSTTTTTSPPPATREPKETAPQTASAVVPAKKSPPAPPLPPFLRKQVVISRGTRIEATLQQTYDYHSAQDGMRITLSVETPLERSGIVVVKKGAKVEAILRKNTQKSELELVILEVESASGKPLKSINTTYRAPAFQKGEKFRVNLDYNRIN